MLCSWPTERQKPKRPTSLAKHNPYPWRLKRKIKKKRVLAHHGWALFLIPPPPPRHVTVHKVAWALSEDHTLPCSCTTHSSLQLLPVVSGVSTLLEERFPWRRYDRKQNEYRPSRTQPYSTTLEQELVPVYFSRFISLGWCLRSLFPRNLLPLSEAMLSAYVEECNWCPGIREYE